MTKKARHHGRQKGRSAPAGDNIASCGFAQRCRAREFLRKLTLDELGIALDNAKEPGRTNFFFAMGWEPHNKRAPALLRARLAMLDTQGIHSVLWMLTAAPMATLAEFIGIERPEEEALPEDFNMVEALNTGLLAAWCQKWPLSLVRVWP